MSRAAELKLELEVVELEERYSALKPARTPCDGCGRPIHVEPTAELQEVKEALRAARKAHREARESR